MGPGRDRTRDPWICSQTRICCQTRYRLRYVARSEPNSLANFCLGPYKGNLEHLCEIILILDQQFRRRCLNNKFYLWLLFYLAEQKNLGNFSRGHYEYTYVKLS